MPKFIVNISLIFTEHTLLGRFRIAREQGFYGVEILNPYETEASEIAWASRDVDTPIHLINVPFGDEWGRGADPQRTLEFRDDIKLATDYARHTNAHHIHVMAGVNGNEKTLTQNLIWASQTFPEQSFLIEPINAIDIPGYRLNSFTDAIAILKHINAPNLGLQFDTYHASRIANSADILPIFNKCLPWIKHIQISGNPNRTEPDKGIVDHAAFFAAVDASCYNGFIGAEYRPASQDFKWMDLER